MFLLDTNIVSELRKRDRTNPGVRAWIDSIADRELYLSVLVAGELRQGVERIRLRDSVQAQHLDRWLQALIDGYGERLLPVDSHVADTWGRMNVPDPISAVDGLLAATALVHDLTLVTRNVKHVKRTGARLLNPFGD
jgi:predicted nucleic acid-binding protein